MDNKEISKENSEAAGSTKLKGCYLLLIISAPKTKEDKEEIIQRVAKGKYIFFLHFFAFFAFFILFKIISGYDNHIMI